ncbi:MAG: hypothetical protein HXY20_06425 [Acidobacteria bacterium]|nr:hypothetical protein [Acidobacteriota bacterium]
MSRTGLLLAVVLLLEMPVRAQSSRGAQGEGDVRVDYTQARREIQAFETVLNNMIASAFSSSPFALVQKTKGVYLAGYGTSFNFLINIHRAMVSTPFGEIRRFEDTSPEQKRKRIEDLTEKLVRTLLEYGSYLTQLSKDESVAIVAFYEDRNFPDEANQNRTIVISATKRDLEEFGGNQNRLKEFRQKVKIIEY